MLRSGEQTGKAIRKLHPVLWNKSMSKENERSIFYFIIEGILVYGARDLDYNSRSGRSKIGVCRNENIGGGACKKKKEKLEWTV